MSKQSKQVDKGVREYLSLIGGRGGQTSRRELTKPQARQMVAIREAKRVAARHGRLSSTFDRWPLTVAAQKVTRPRPPAIAKRRFRIYP
jgi:hypothetical protein